MRKRIQEKKPPIIAKWLLKKMIFYEEEYSNSENLNEEFYFLVNRRGILYAKVWYFLQVILTSSFYLKIRSFWSFVMLVNYLKIAFRNLVKNKITSSITISGLTIGFTTCFLILIWVHDELSYDRFHKNHDHIYKVVCRGERILNDYDGIPALLSEIAVSEIPEVKNAARVLGIEKRVFSYRDKSFYEKGGIFTDPSFFSIFSFPFNKGDAKSALSNLNSIVITEQMSKKYFGDEDPIGQLLKTEEKLFTVSGVLKDIPSNSHIQFDYIISLEQIRSPNAFDWSSFSFVTYLLVNPNSKLIELSEKLTKLAETNNSNQVINDGVSFRLEPLSKIHLHDKNSFRSWVRFGNATYVYIFSLIAFVILIIACINFINLTTARSSIRAKEVGIRKTIGANRNQIKKQFMGESFLSIGLASMVAIGLTQILLPYFSRIMNKDLSFNILNIESFGYLGLIVLLAGTGASFYPAILLSKFQPIKVLNRSFNLKSKKSILRRVLVVTQISITLILIISSIVLYNQLHFLQHKNLGFNKENIIYLPIKGNIGAQYASFKNDLLSLPEISGVTAQNYTFAETQWYGNTTKWEGNHSEKSASFIWNKVDYNFFDFMNLTILEGRAFSKEYTSDAKQAFIINETAARRFEMDNPVGKEISFAGRTGKIVGIVKDANFRPLRDKIAPHLFLVLNDKSTANDNGVILVELNGETNIDLYESIKKIKSIWEVLDPISPFEYHVLDQAYENFYLSEKKIRKLLTYFTFLGIFISCLGLFGLFSNIIERRTKEIGIRKILGASVQKIIFTLSREIIILTLLANLIASPLAFYIMNKWLQNFNYRISLNLWIFLLSGVIILILTFSTISFQIIKAARAKPANSLKYE